MATHTLYYNPFSVCSIMVRYAWAVRGESKGPELEIRIHEEPIDILTGEQLSEHFLCDINANGEVPVLAPPDSKRCIPESLDITYYLAQSYPTLNPEAHQSEIKRLLEELHGISYFALTFTGKPQAPQKSISDLREKLNGDISERYRHAIEHKIKRVQSAKVSALSDESVQNAIDKTKRFLGEVEKLLSQSKTGWILGTSEPTALDAHVVVFLARLIDINRDNLIPEPVRAYANKAKEQTAFVKTMQGRRTMPPGYFK